MSDLDADEITRPDISGAVVAGEEAPSSGFHQRVERVLVPYSAVPVLTGRLNEPTVPDAALRVSMAAARAPEHHTPRDASVPPQSGPRPQSASTLPPHATASTVPPSARGRAHEPATSGDGRGAEMARQTAETWRRKKDPSPRIPTPLPSVQPLPLPAPPPEKRLRAYVLIVVTTFTAAMIGVGLGNGSLVRLGGRLHTAFVGPDDAPAPLASTPAAPSRPVSSLPTPAAAPQPAPRTVVAEQGPKVPVLRVEELPTTQHDAKPVEARPSETKRSRRAPRR